MFKKVSPGFWLSFVVKTRIKRQLLWILDGLNFREVQDGRLLMGEMTPTLRVVCARKDAAEVPVSVAFTPSAIAIELFGGIAGKKRSGGGFRIRFRFEEELIRMDKLTIFCQKES